MRRHFIFHTNINKLIKAVVLLCIPIGILTIIFWNVFPIARIILFLFLAISSIVILDKSLSFAMGRAYSRKKLFIFLSGLIIGWIAVSNGLLPKLTITLLN